FITSYSTLYIFSLSLHDALPISFGFCLNDIVVAEAITHNLTARLATEFQQALIVSARGNYAARGNAANHVSKRASQPLHASIVFGMLVVDIGDNAVRGPPFV